MDWLRPNRARKPLRTVLRRTKCANPKVPGASSAGAALARLLQTGATRGEQTMEKLEKRVLVVEPVREAARQAAKRIAAAGGHPFIVGSVAEARRTEGTFDRGIFAFDLPDGSGIVLAAEMILEDRVRDVEFLHPDEEADAQGRNRSERFVLAREYASAAE